MEAKLIKTFYGYELLTQGFVKGSTNHELIDSLNIEEGNIRYKLSHKNCQAIENGYDLDELAEEYANKKRSIPTTEFRIEIFTLGFKDGFQKALSILGDKKFSEEDMMNAYRQGGNDGATCESMCEHYDNTEDIQESMRYGDKCREEFIQSLQQTEWDVIILEECLDSTCDGVNRKGECITTGKYKFDTDGCLILKRK